MEEQSCALVILSLATIPGQATACATAEGHPFMGLISLRRWLAVCLLVIVPALARASDPVELLKKALKIDPGTGKMANLEVAKDRNKRIEGVIPELKSVQQM